MKKANFSLTFAWLPEQLDKVKVKLLWLAILAFLKYFPVENFSAEFAPHYFSPETLQAFYQGMPSPWRENFLPCFTRVYGRMSSWQSRNQNAPAG